MQSLKLMNTEPTRLSTKAVYQINQCLYRYLYRDNEGKVAKYVFRPLNGQKRTADLKLSTQKIYSMVQEVSELYGQINAQPAPCHTQLSLF